MNTTKCGLLNVYFPKIKNENANKKKIIFKLKDPTRIDLAPTCISIHDGKSRHT